MEPRDLHDLTPAYALDALDPVEAAAYEEHLGQCEACREELTRLNESATALAWAAAGPAPSARLRGSILDAAAAERWNVVPLLRSSWAFRATAAAAAAAAAAAIGLGVWGTRSHSGPVVSAVIAVDASGHATLRVSGLAAAPQGKTYEAWIIPAGGGPAHPAGLFSGGGTSLLRLRGTVRRGSTVAATLERAGGVRAPTQPPVFSART